MDNLEVAIKAAITAGEKVLKIYNSGKFDINYKNDNSPLTEADLASNTIIVDHLKTTNIPILSEEGKHISFDERKNWKKLWIVDPIDGTKEFVKRNGEFTINIALIENQKPIIGVIYAPVLNDLYFSNEKFGSRKINLSNNFNDFTYIINNSIRLPLKRKEKSYVVVASRSHMNELTENFILNLKTKYDDIKLISKGSSLKICLVAEGFADCYPRFAPTMEWDTAAGQAICDFAGFDLIDVNTSNPMIYNRENLLNNHFIINNKIKNNGN